MVIGMLILAVGDVVGAGGCDYLLKKLPAFKRHSGVEVCIVNGENSAQGNGITPESCEELFDAGADLVTTGNHVYKQRRVYEYLDSSKPVLRPFNYNDSNPGRGVGVIDKGAYKVGVINLLGNAFLEAAGNPFFAADEALKQLADCRIIIVDIHAEATSEKSALGFYLDGRVTAVVGTHTHVQTADERLLPGGTAYITDLGMTGAADSVLGIRPELAIEKFKYLMPVRFDAAQGEHRACGVLIEADKSTGKALGIERVVF